tara:strand:- start:9064 stop:10680 length:1617 start_codon:yes stop_codon:yes gene_type:complete
MIILGIHSSLTANSHDPSITLIKNGKLIFALEEERVNRNKTSNGRFPEFAIKNCLNFLKISIKQIDIIALDGTTFKKNKFKIERMFKFLFGYCPKILVFNHADCHNYGSFYSSHFEQSLVVSLDGIGDRVSTQVCTASRKKGLKVIWEEGFEGSLGIFYTIFTNFLGFQSIEGEYKLMGMAAYGKPRFKILKNLIYFDEKKEKIVINFSKIFDYKFHSSIQEPKYHPNLEKFINIKRPINTKSFTQSHFDLAASVQYAFEIVYIKILKYFLIKTGMKNLCLSGGCALNCLANSKIDFINTSKNLYVMPSASDRGLSLGAAAKASFQKKLPMKSVPTVFLGKKYKNINIIKAIKQSGLKFIKLDNIYKITAKNIVKGKVIGWFQDRSEFGPRALGNRSILASTNFKNMKNILNEKIKFRESYRPFAPSVLQEDVHKVTSNTYINEFMTNICPIETNKDLLSEAINVDGTARLHTVNKKSNLKLFKLLKEIKKISGFGAVINTSFNLAGEPIVESPEDAIRTFVSSDIDFLIIGNYMLNK